jgi:hypothetical protein
VSFGPTLVESAYCPDRIPHFDSRGFELFKELPDVIGCVVSVMPFSFDSHLLTM